jgi:hypothetical protein
MFDRIRSRLKGLWSSPTAHTAMTGYLAMISTMATGLITVPMALRFLTKEEFGLWSIVGQSLG